MVEREQRFTVLVAFGLVYLFWGSTYLAIDIAVQHIPPALMCALRFSISGPLMLAYCAITGRPVRASATDLLKLAVVGILLLTGGNLTLAWAEQYVSTGLSALILASTPIWFLIIDSWVLRGERISRGGLVGVGLGIAGMLVLIWPQLGSNRQFGSWQLIAVLGLLFSAVSWAVGSVLSRQWDHGGDPFVGTGWQMTFAAAANLMIALASREQKRANWTAHGLEAVFYLVIFGSWVGYTAYIYLLKHAPTAKVSTHAYVNPVIAVFLGWLILHERVDIYIFAGTAVIVASVVLVTSARVKAPSEQATSKQEVPALEAAD